MTLDEFFALCKMRVDELGLKFVLWDGLVRATNGKDGEELVCHCPVSLATGDVDDFHKSVHAACLKLSMDWSYAMAIVLAADNWLMERKYEDGKTVRGLRHRMLDEFGLTKSEAVTT